MDADQANPTPESDAAARKALAPHGRGAGDNPTNRFESMSLHVLPEYVEQVVAEEADESAPGGRRLVRTQVFADRTRTAVNPVDSPDIHFKWSINPYRGCEHGCTYCYARPYHEYLGWSSGLDFETKILAKFDAPGLVRAHLLKPGWAGETIVMSGVTDPYQPVEAKLGITRGILEVLREFRQPVSLITKNRLIARDVDILGELARHGAAHAAVSVTTLDNTLAASMEPRASSPRDRLAAISELSGAGVPVRAMLGPIIPGLNDREIPALLEAAKRAGATRAGYVLLRLPYQVKSVFFDWLSRRHPEKRARIETMIRETRDGELSGTRFGERQTGTGAVSKMIADTFTVFARKLGLLDERPSQAWDGHEHDGPARSRRASPFRVPPRGAQPGETPSLFGVEGEVGEHGEGFPSR